MNIIFLILFTLAKSQNSEKNEYLTQILSKEIENKEYVKISNVFHFEKLIQLSDMWADKSWLIKEIWEYPETVLVISAATRWGKTTNLQMFKYHAQIVFDKDGNIVESNRTNSYKYFVEGKVSVRKGFITLKDGKKPMISTQNKINEEHLAQHPVIHMEGADLEMGNLKTIGIMISNAYKKHATLRKRVKHNAPHNLETFDNFLKLEKARELPTDILIQGIKLLSEILYDAYQRHVVIVFDEHDKYIHDAYFKSDSFKHDNETKDFLTTLRNLLGKTFKDNTNLAKGIISGVLGLNVPILDSALNNAYNIHAFIHPKFSPFYGIYGHEFSDMMIIAGLNEKFQIDATQWYDGYRVPSLPNTPMYSTYSVCNSINNRLVANYYTQSLLVGFLPHILHQNELQNDLLCLLRSWNITKHDSMTITKSSINSLTEQDLAVFQRFRRGNDIYISDQHRNIVFSLFVSIGLATFDLNMKASEKEIGIRLPNLEIYEFFQSQWIKSIRIAEGKYSECKTIIKTYAFEPDTSDILDEMTKCLFDVLYVEAGSTPFQFLPRRSATTAVEKPPFYDIIPKSILMNEATMESFLYITIRGALLHRAKSLGECDGTILTKSAQQLDSTICDMNRHKIDMLFVIKDTAVLIFENKYRKLRGRPINIDNTFKQALSYSCFFREYDMKAIPMYKFLAINTHYDGTLELMSATLTLDQLNNLMQNAETNLKKENLTHLIEKANYDTWNTTMYDEILKIKPSVILKSSYNLKKTN